MEVGDIITPGSLSNVYAYTSKSNKAELLVLSTSEPPPNTLKVRVLKGRHGVGTESMVDPKFFEDAKIASTYSLFYIKSVL